MTTTPYFNTIAAHVQPEYPGDLKIEKRIRNLLRWNAMAMVVRVNHQFPGIGGHLASYCFGTGGPLITVTDYIKMVPDQIRQWIPGQHVTLGTGGFGRSDKSNTGTRTFLNRRKQR